MCALKLINIHIYLRCGIRVPRHQKVQTSLQRIPNASRPYLHRYMINLCLDSAKDRWSRWISRANSPFLSSSRHKIATASTWVTRLSSWTQRATPKCVGVTTALTCVQTYIFMNYACKYSRTRICVQHTNIYAQCVCVHVRSLTRLWWLNAPACDDRQQAAYNAGHRLSAV